MMMQVWGDLTVRFTCPHCGQGCDADLRTERAAEYRCAVCRHPILLPDLLDYVLTDGELDRIIVLDPVEA